MIEGTIDEFGRPLIDVVVLGNRAQATVPAVLDTGFNGDVSQPVEVAIDLGLELSSAGEFQLANGSVQRAMLFAGQVRWGNGWRHADILVTFGEEALLGIALLEGYDVHLDFRTRRVTIE